MWLISAATLLYLTQILRPTVYAKIAKVPKLNVGEDVNTWLVNYRNRSNGYWTKGRKAGLTGSTINTLLRSTASTSRTSIRKRASKRVVTRQPLGSAKPYIGVPVNVKAELSFISATTEETTTSKTSTVRVPEAIELGLPNLEIKDGLSTTSEHTSTTQTDTPTTTPTTTTKDEELPVLWRNTPSAELSTGSSSSQMPCPLGGIWSEWQTKGECDQECGACGSVQRVRKCLSYSNDQGCPCLGKYKTVTVCNVKPCKYPQPACCPPSDLMYRDDIRIYCGPQTEDVIATELNLTLANQS